MASNLIGTNPALSYQNSYNLNSLAIANISLANQTWLNQTNSSNFNRTINYETYFNTSETIFLKEDVHKMIHEY